MLGNVLQPHTDGVLALPFSEESVSPEATPRVISVGRNNRASPTLGIASAKKVHGTRLATRLASLQKENDAAKTAPTNQQNYLPPLVTPKHMLTCHHLRTNATQIQEWYRHHPLRQRCVLQNRDTLQTLTARTNHAAATIQQCLLHHSTITLPLLLVPSPL